MTLTKPPIPYEKVESWLKSYKHWKARSEYVQSKIPYIPSLTRTLQMVAAHSEGRKNGHTTHRKSLNMKFRCCNPEPV